VIYHILIVSSKPLCHRKNVLIIINRVRCDPFNALIYTYILYRLIVTESDNNIVCRSVDENIRTRGSSLPTATAPAEKTALVAVPILIFTDTDHRSLQLFKATEWYVYNYLPHQAYDNIV
jgi:hypothetical protein